jgi:hypothetical protein
MQIIEKETSRYSFKILRRKVREYGRAGLCKKSSENYWQI